MKKYFVLAFTPLFLFSCLEKKVEEVVPNIVVILADDIGLGDISYYQNALNPGQQYSETPNIDWLIENGMRFDVAHSPGTLCSPSRFGILTGIFPWKTSIPNGVWNPFKDVQKELTENNLALLAKKAGYQTAFIGKWGMGGNFEKTTGESLYNNYDLSKRSQGPLQLGFDYSFELPTGIQGFTYLAYENDQWFPLSPNSTISLLDTVQTKISIAKKLNKKPHQLGDSAWDPSAIGGLLVDKATAFIDTHFQNNPQNPFFLHFCSQAIHVPLVPSARFKKNKTYETDRAALVSEFDQQVGAIIASLEKNQALDNTIIFVSSDNGAFYDPDLQSYQSNLSLRGYKGSIWEGGSRVPFVVYQHGAIKPGSRSSTLISHIDVYASIADLLGFNNDSAPDSKSLLPILYNQESSYTPHSQLIMKDDNHNYFLKSDEYKLIYRFDEGKNMELVALFFLPDNEIEDPEKNLLNDPNYRDVVKRLTAEVEELMKESKKLTYEPKK